MPERRKIYTKTGDLGETSLLGGTRVPKSHKRVDAYGTIDELNSFLGLLRDQPIAEHYRKVLLRIQEDLFIAEARIAADPRLKHTSLPVLQAEDCVDPVCTSNGPNCPTTPVYTCGGPNCQTVSPNVTCVPTACTHSGPNCQTSCLADPRLYVCNPLPNCIGPRNLSCATLHRAPFARPRTSRLPLPNRSRQDLRRALCQAVVLRAC